MTFLQKIYLTLTFYSLRNQNLIPAKSDTKSINEERRKSEDKLAVIFLVKILSFIFCHLPRVALDFHEIFTLEHSNFCAEHKMPNTFPAWSFVAIYVSHLCLVINATLNMCIYCFMSEAFRDEVCIIFKKIWCYSKVQT